MDKIGQAIYGMSLDQVFFQRKPGFLSYALNANIQSKDGFGITYTNEPSNQLCVTFPAGYKLIGYKTVISRNEVIVALSNPSGGSEIGKITNYNCNSLTALNVEYDCKSCRGKILDSKVDILTPCCNYETIVNAECLNFSVDYPVKMAVKITNCGYKIYLTDYLNEPRYIDLDDPNGIDACNVPYGTFNCERIKIFKDFCMPRIEPVSVESGGSLLAGTYQATAAYCDINGKIYTDYFDISNPVPIFDRTLTVDTDYPTNKSIKFKITHNTDLFEYFKVSIVKTVNETSEYIDVGVYRVGTTSNITFTNNDKTLTKNDLFTINKDNPNYTKARFIEESSDHLLLGDLANAPDYNFQPFVNQLKLYWETVEMPYDSNNSYGNPIVSAKFRGYMRDEVYPFAIVFRMKDGKKTKAYHIPNRVALTFDLQPVTNLDGFDPEGCIPAIDHLRWTVYNTGSRIGDKPVPSPTTTFPDSKVCDISRLDYGDFSYWESTEKYPCDERIWGTLADTPIRYHKFPDSVITHIHDAYTPSGSENDNYNHASTIKPVGVRLDEATFNGFIDDNLVYDPIQSAAQGKDVYIKPSDLICGFEIVRGNRVGNKSIDAKGLLYDVGRVVEKDDVENNNPIRSYYIPNYPYNDLGDDPYISINSHIYDTTDAKDPIEDTYRLNAYSYDDSFRRFTFHSPDTHFQSPSLGTELKLETEEYGVQRGHFVPVEKHPRYKFLTTGDTYLATSLGLLASVKIKKDNSGTIAGINTGSTGHNSVEIDYADLMSTANSVLDLLEKLIPIRNFAYDYHSIGNYNNYHTVPNNGFKRRSLQIAKYLSPNNQNVGDDASVHNYQRESSVYLRTTSKFGQYVEDEKSRVTLGKNRNIDDNWCEYPGEIKASRIRSYYGSIKKFVPDQYGNIDQVDYIATGYTVTLVNGLYQETYYPTFGGDTFINKFALKRKMPFFTQNMVGRPDDVSFDYDLVPNVGFPTYYLGTSPDEAQIKNILTPANLTLILAGIATVYISGYAGPLGSDLGFVAGEILLTAGVIDIYSKMLSSFIPKNNLDCDTTTTGKNPTLFYQSGKFYLANYGIPNFFVESDVNVEYRFARNEKEENFYPNVGTDIPDNWLQEATVPILHDNKYNYNATYSKQNYERKFLPFNNHDFNKLCQSNFPNRVIYSEKSSLEENFDNWLRYSSLNYKDFDKSNGNMIGVHSLDNNRLLVRFENTFQMWNTRITLPSNSPLQVSLAGSGMFTTDPVEFAKTFTGYGGSQHMAFENTKAGTFWVDAKRGSVFKFSTNLEEISLSNYNWFKENLPFKITKDFPTVNIDNAFKNIGISLCWDERFQRLFITKKDYQILPEQIGKVFYIKDIDGIMKFVRYDDTVPFPVQYEVSLDDELYFANKSFTIAWSPLINNWVSFYSFLPNYYISHTTHFQSGVGSSVWNHGLSNLSYQVYYNDNYPYILEFPLQNIPKSEYLKSVTVNNDILKYTSETDYYSLKSVNKDNYNIFFNKAIIWNREQCSGLLNLVETPINNMSEKMKYPKFNSGSIDILYGKYDKVCTFNAFFDATGNHSNGQPIFTNEWSSIQSQYPIDKVLNLDNFNYRNSYSKMPIKSNECYVRLIQDVHTRYKFINNFEIFQQETRNQ